MIDKSKLYSQIEQLQSLLASQTTAYDYEKTFDEEWQKITTSVFSSSLGKVPKSKNKKNNRDQIWKGNS